jgi:hypothetical protein
MTGTPDMPPPADLSPIRNKVVALLYVKSAQADELHEPPEMYSCLVFSYMVPVRPTWTHYCLA